MKTPGHFCSLWRSQSTLLPRKFRSYFIAALIRSALGFGEALIAVPLLAFCLPLRVAAPLAVLVSITIASIVIVQDWKKIHLYSTGWLVLSTLVGIPVGLLFLTSSQPREVKAVLALIIIAFSAYSLTGRKPIELRHDNRVWLLVFGFFAGVLGGAYGMNGPPLAIYGAMRRWSAQHFRATLQAYFLPASIIGSADDEAIWCIRGSAHSAWSVRTGILLI